MGSGVELVIAGFWAGAPPLSQRFKRPSCNLHVLPRPADNVPQPQHSLSRLALPCTPDLVEPCTACPSPMVFLAVATADRQSR